MTSTHFVEVVYLLHIHLKVTKSSPSSSNFHLGWWQGARFGASRIFSTFSIIKSTNLVNGDPPMDLCCAHQCHHCHQYWPSPSLPWWSRRTWPKTTCLPSSHWVLAVQRKNWEPLVFGPALAMESTPGEMREKLGHSLAAHKYDQNRLNCNFCTVLPFPYWSRTGRSKSVEMRDA